MAVHRCLYRLLEKGLIKLPPTEFYRLEEGLCVQMMHIGSFDNEPASVEKMDLFLEEKGYRNDFSQQRLHHEIYLSDARKVPPERWKTVIRHPIAKAVQ